MCKKEKNKDNTTHGHQKCVWIALVVIFGILVGVFAVFMIVEVFNTLDTAKDITSCKAKIDIIKMKFFVICVLIFSVCLTIIACKIIKLITKSIKVSKEAQNIEILQTTYKTMFQPQKCSYHVVVKEEHQERNLEISVESIETEKSE